MRCAFLLLAPLAGCSLEVSVPLALEVAAPVLDVDAERTALEDQLCADAASAPCNILRALARSDAAQALGGPRPLEEQPLPRMPVDLPRSVSVRGEQIDVARWLDARRRDVHDLVPDSVFTVDTPAPLLATGGDLIEALVLEDAALVFADNTLTFDVPALDLLAGPTGGELVRVGRSEPLAAGETGRAAIALVDGGSDQLRAALATGSLDVVVSIAGNEALTLRPGSVEDTWARPGGAAHVRLVLDVSVPVGPDDLAVSSATLPQ